MQDAAVISGSLVDAKNVNTHKVMRLIIDVPAENALKVIAAFGWPTMVNPVSVAVARLNDSIRSNEARHGSCGDLVGLRNDDDNDHHHVEINAAPRSDQSVGVPAGADKPKKSPAQIAGYLCTLGIFQQFLRSRVPAEWAAGVRNPDNTSVEEIAADAVRDYCGVRSRSELTDKNANWSALLLAYRLWEKEAEVVPA